MSSTRRLLLRLLFVGVGLFALGWTLSWMHPRQVLAMALEANAWLLIASIVPLAGRFLIWGFKWQRMLNRESPVPLGFAMSNLMAGTFVNLTTPTAKLAGGVLRSLLIHRRFGWSRAVAYGWTLSDQLTNVLGTLLVFAVVASLYGSSLPSGSPGSALLGAGMVAWLLVFGALILRRPGWKLIRRPGVIRALGRIVPRRFQKARSAAARGSWVERMFRPVLADQRLLGPLPDVLWSVASFGALCVSNLMILRSLGAEVTLTAVTITVVIGYFAGTGIGGFGGLGVTEAAMTAIYVQIGVMPETAAAGVLLHRASYYLLALVWGGAALLAQGRYPSNGISEETSISETDRSGPSKPCSRRSP